MREEVIKSKKYIWVLTATTVYFCSYKEQERSSPILSIFTYEKHKPSPNVNNVSYPSCQYWSPHAAVP